jgi:cytochrome c oxidase subunit 1
VGAFVFGFSQLLFAYIIIKAIRGGEPAHGEVWEGAEAHGLEWHLPSPPPYHTWTTPPAPELIMDKH